MPKIIDAEKVFCSDCEFYGDCDNVTCDVKSMPTIEAEPVVHGRWEDEYGGKYANPRYRCSVCKERALYRFELDELRNYKEVQALEPYCPNCGAKMDAEGGEANGS